MSYRILILLAIECSNLVPLLTAFILFYLFFQTILTLAGKCYF